VHAPIRTFLFTIVAGHMPSRCTLISLSSSQSLHFKTFSGQPESALVISPLIFLILFLYLFWKTNKWVLNKAGVKRELLDTQSKEDSILWSHHKDTRKLPGERDNARNNVRCTQARKTTHDLDGQRQYVDRTPCGRVS